MANKKQTARRAAHQRQQQEAKLLRIAGIVVAAIVVIGLVYTYLPKSKGAQPSEVKQWSAPPALTIDSSVQYFATIRLQKGGEILIELYADKAPLTVNNFIFLAREGFFNGTTFHRVLEGFMAQGGDPSGTGSGGPGYEFQNEVSDLVFDKAGVVAMANAGPDTNGSQFFITFGPAEWLNGGYTIFGQVVQGMDIVNSIALRDPDTATTPGDMIETVAISER
ncbi:MAG: hypothetical protein HFACDABA_00176 [Anaerolineales bacterium]|nr:hypothetical protein [Anaerolineales bacterium]